jgi:hypothetical protein
MNKLPTINIKGHEYVMVKDRILAFNATCPNGRITTEIIKYENGKVVIKATVVPDVKNPDRFFTDYSQADESQGMVNKTSALENASTSSIGRCLALMGIGILDGVASADEMKKAGADKTPDPTDDWPTQKDEFCKVHNKPMKPRTASNGGTFYDHRAKGFLDGPEGDEFMVSEEGKWHVCSGKGWKLSAAEVIRNAQTI